MHRLAVLLAISTLLLVVAGGLVTSNDAGLSVPDWPLSYGKLMPLMEGGVFYEHGHRMVATWVGFLTTILAIWLWRSEPRPWLRRLGFAALGAVIVQGLLGGMTVIFMLPKPVSITHACLAEIFFSTTVALVLFTSAWWQREPVTVEDAGSPPLRLLALAAPLVVLAQVALGAAARHHALNVIPHIAGALVTSAFVLWVGLRVLMAHSGNTALRRGALALISITTLQVFLGIAAYISRLMTANAPQPMPVMVWFTVIHVAVGALTLAASVVMALLVSRHVRDGYAIRQVVANYAELTKPSITWLILMSAAVGYFFGAREGGFGVATFLHTMLGIGLIASGTAALNQCYEHEADAKMRRTCTRPIPSGRTTVRRSLIFAVALSFLGFLQLAWGANLLAACLGLFTLASYLFLYTPLKQRTPVSTTVGALPGAMPPMIGFAAAAGTITAEAWVLFAILFLWQFPHFYAIAWMYREDYARAGIRMLPVVEPDGRSTARQIVVTALLLIPVSLVPSYLGMTGRIYLAGTLALGLWFFYSGVRVASDRTTVRARSVLLVSIVYLPLVYGLMILDRPGL
jgi:heme o synthase